MIENSEHIVQQLRLERKKKQLSQKDLGKRVGLPQGHISNIEKGTVDLKTSSLIEIARALELELMLVPRQQVNLVKTLNTQASDSDQAPPAYRLEDREIHLRDRR